MFTIINNIYPVLQLPVGIHAVFYADDVKPKGTVTQVICAHKVSCGPAQALLFAPCHGSFGKLIPAFYACFHFDKYKRISIPGNNIDFTAAAAIIFPNNTVTDFTQKSGRALFTLSADGNISGFFPGPGRPL